MTTFTLTAEIDNHGKTAARLSVNSGMAIHQAAPVIILATPIQGSDAYGRNPNALRLTSIAAASRIGGSKVHYVAQGGVYLAGGYIYHLPNANLEGTPVQKAAGQGPRLAF